MRPYRTFTKNNRGAIGYTSTTNGRVTAHLTSCGGKDFNGNLTGRSYVKGASGKNRAQALDNLDKRLVQIARCIQSKSTDKQLQAYLKRIGLRAEKYALLSGYMQIVEGNGFAKARFYARRVLRAHEMYQAASAA